MLSKICVLSALIAVCTAADAVSVKALKNDDYHVSFQEVSFPQAWAYCKNSGYKFTSVNSGVQNTNLEQYLANLGISSATFWIGGIYLRNGPLNKWYWVDGLDGIDSFSYTNWALPLYYYYDSCIVLNYSSVTKKGTWSSEPCGSLKYFICDM